MSIFNINLNIYQAETLSTKFYLSNEIFGRAKEMIFAKTWHLVENFDENSNLVPFNILETPLVLSKNNEKIKCFSNVCTHRGAVLVDEKCQANGIRCRYHGRRFDLDGKFLSMPEFESVQNFPTKKDDLTHVSCEKWGIFNFVSLNPIAPFKEFSAEMQNIVKLSENIKFAGTKDYEVNAHWALYCENYLEGFHVPFVHKSLNETIDYGSYTTETFRYSSLQTAFDEKGDLAAHYFFIFPNLMFNFYPWGISVNIVKPQDIDRTTITYLTFVLDESKLNIGAGADLETVEFEDQAVVESVQKGIRSRFYNSGRYSPNREQGTHHFQRLICEFMKEETD